MKFRYFLLALFLKAITVFPAFSSNVEVANLTVYRADNPLFAFVEFDLRWRYAWRDAINHDACWVFVKFREVGAADRTFRHLKLHNTGHSVNGGVITPGRVNTSAAYNASTNPAVGAMIYSSANGVFPILALDKVRLYFNIADNNLSGITGIDIEVHAIEMVYVAEGAFYVGDGDSDTQRRFYSHGTVTTNPFQIGSGNITLGQNLGNLWAVSSHGGNNIETSGTINATSFPTGFRAFYAMKYPVSQAQYVAFLNSLSYSQQQARVDGNLADWSSYPYVMRTGAGDPQARNSIRYNGEYFFCDLNENGMGGNYNDGEWIAMNWVNWMDAAAYLDWAGLRPMTELEFEKAARGPEYPIPGEFAWGTAAATQALGLINAGTAIEVPSNTGANAVFHINYPLPTGGPVRNGMFATPTSTRVQAGASYWGLMEMSGNVWEFVVTVANATGRGFTGLHGNGMITLNGNAGVLDWPGYSAGEVTGANGSGLRGGSFQRTAIDMRVSSRTAANAQEHNRLDDNGFRGVRTAQ